MTTESIFSEPAPQIKALVCSPSAFTTLFAPGKSWDYVRTTTAPYTESRLAHLVRNKCVGFPVVEQNHTAEIFNRRTDEQFNRPFLAICSKLHAPVQLTMFFCLIFSCLMHRIQDTEVVSSSTGTAVTPQRVRTYGYQNTLVRSSKVADKYSTKCTNGFREQFCLRYK